MLGQTRRFELWYLLHFNLCQTPICRADYPRLIEKELKKLGVHYKYEKNSNDMYRLLKAHGRQDLAIKHAKQLEAHFKGQSDFANHNPCTKVHHLVAELFGQAKWIK